MPRPIQICTTMEDDWATTVGIGLAMELWFKLGRPVKLPPPVTPDAKAFWGLCRIEGLHPDLRLIRDHGMVLMREAAQEGCLLACEYLAWNEVSQPQNEAETKEMLTWAWKAAKGGRAETIVTHFATTHIPSGHPILFTKEMEAFLTKVVPFDREAACYPASIMAPAFPEHSMQWARRALADGSNRADYEMAACLIKLRRNEEAVLHLRAGAERRDSRCAHELLLTMKDSPEVFLELGMHRDRYLMLSVHDGNPYALQVYVEECLKRDTPGSVMEACRALLALQYSNTMALLYLQDYDMNELACRAYPRKKGRVPVSSGWDWIFDRLAAAPRRENLFEYGYFWKEFAFDPNRDKHWLGLEN